MFQPGLSLAKSFFFEAVKPVVANQFPQLSYGAGLLGDGSEILGFDTAISTDHDWGPRLQIFFSEGDFTRHADVIIRALEEELPESFYGYATNFPDHDRATRLDRCFGSPRHGVEAFTVASFLKRELGVGDHERMSCDDWLSSPEPKLLGLASGAVFADANRSLERMRSSLAYYPDDIWLHLIAAEWRKISQENSFIGRAGDVGDEIGSALIANRLSESCMRLCFLFERRFAPYAKWFGAAFQRLNCSGRIKPLVMRVQTASDWKAREKRFCELALEIGALHGELGVPGATSPTIGQFHERPYFVVNADAFVASAREQIKDPEVAALPLCGSICQISNNVDALARPQIRRALISAVARERDLPINKV